MRPSMQRVRRALTEFAPRVYDESLLLRDLRMLDLGSGIDPREMHRFHPVTVVAGLQFILEAAGAAMTRAAWFHAVIEKFLLLWKTQGDDDERAVVLRLLLGQGTEFGCPRDLLYVNGQTTTRHQPSSSDVLFRLRTMSVRRVDVRCPRLEWHAARRSSYRVGRDPASGSTARLSDCIICQCWR